jgi:hypothetical protein
MTPRSNPCSIVKKRLHSSRSLAAFGSSGRLVVIAAALASRDGSVLQWYASEARGAGDLRFYASVQAYSPLVLLLALVFPKRYTRTSDFSVVVGFYALAKALETLDRPIVCSGTDRERPRPQAPRGRCCRVLDTADAARAAASFRCSFMRRQANESH